MNNITGKLRPRVVTVALLLASLPVVPAAADDKFPSGKSIAVIVGTTAGGSTDVSARLIASFLGKHLPGKPSLVVHNRPGARGMTAMNYFAQQATPDGLTTIVGSGSQIDPINYRVAQSNYDPSKFEIVGALGIGGATIMIHKSALPRLTDKTAAPVIMATIGGVPRSGMQMAAWGIDYLGWNAKWVAGYRGNPDLMLAFERGEVDMTSFANTQMKPELYDKNKYVILYQSGSNRAMVPSAIPELAGVPMFTEAMKGRISDPLARQAFDYWRNISSINNWMGLPPKTSAAIVATYRAGFGKLMQDKEFLAQSKKVGDDVSTVSAEDMADTIKSLAALPPAALEYMKGMLARQGLKTPKKKKKSD